ncbi:testis-expressed protein 30-like [Lineus longissimus]|uniref:testis-expressed protein 30-like n=1 Tax=Lineus longissimus TaxID=88925 RepID=UPI00315DA626
MTCKTQPVSIPYEKKEIQGYVTTVSNPVTGIILTHGAGGDANSANLDILADHLADKGFLVLRFTCKGLNIRYRVKVFKAVLEWFRKAYPLTSCFLAGRSMGSRAAVITANETIGDTFIQGVICLAYPLQKSQNDVSKDREQPLRDLGCPALLISGSLDDMMSQTRIKDISRDNDKLEIFWVDGAGHSLKKRKNDMSSVTLVNETMSAWCKKITGAKPENSVSVDNGITKGKLKISVEVLPGKQKRKFDSLADRKVQRKRKR